MCRALPPMVQRLVQKVNKLSNTHWYALAVFLVNFGVLQAMADTAPAKKTAHSDQLPDWSGFWESNVDFKHEPSHDPPYNAEWKGKSEAALAKQPARFYCAEGMPTMLQVPDTINMFDVLITPKLTVMVFSNHEVRHIYTDGRSHPAKADLWPTPEGDSIGHWEGDTLVVDTISTKPQLMVLAVVEFDSNHSAPVSVKSSPTSDQLRIVERIRLAKGGILEDQMTIEDPIAFAHPWKQIYTFHRLTDLNRMIFEDCVENERDFIHDGKAIMIERPDQDQKARP
jgi:hypothetical protein